MLAIALLLGMAGVARAATPQDICKDLADGKVDGTYTTAEWNAFFSDPTIQGYGCGGVTPTPSTPGQPAPPVSLTPRAGVQVSVSEVAGTSKTVQVPTPSVPTKGVAGAQHTVRAPVTKQASAPLGTAKKSGTLPFTGAQLTLFLLVGLGLVATGLVLRATGRRQE